MVDQFSAGGTGADEAARARRLCAWFVVFLALFLLALIALAVVTARLAAVLPERVPLKLDDARPVRWGSREDWVRSAALSDALLTLTGLGLTALLPRLPMDWVNLPSPWYWRTPERFRTAIHPVQCLLLGLLTLVAGLVAWGQLEAWWYLRRGPAPAWTDDALVGGLLFGIAVGVVLLLGALRVPASARTRGGAA